MGSFGFGDRIGLATAGHVEAMRRAGAGIEPIFAQQSIREMARTGRSPERVIADARAGMRAAGWPAGGVRADADHLKGREDVDRCAAAGFDWFTIDPSDWVDAEAGRCDEDALREKLARIEERVGWVPSYVGRTILLGSGTVIEMTEDVCRRAAVKYGLAIEHACAMAEHIAAVASASGRDFVIELSVDETDEPTSLAEHWIVAEQCARRGVRLSSLAPRLPGDFEKGVDYRGDLVELEKALRDHAAIAAELGGYQLSLHSGSDKLSMYGALGRATGGKFHVKTAGTSYLEALRVAARERPELFVRIVEFARGRYDADRATYHLSATLDDAPPAGDVADPAELERLYLGDWGRVPAGRGFTEPGRQILHCTFGSVLTDPELGCGLRDVLETHRDAHREVLAQHFARHLEALVSGTIPARGR